MLDCSMADAVGRIPLSNNVKLALHYRQGQISKFVEIAIAYERGQGKKCDSSGSCVLAILPTLQPSYPRSSVGM